MKAKLSEKSPPQKPKLKLKLKPKIEREGWAQIVHGDQVEALLTDWLMAAYEAAK